MAGDITDAVGKFRKTYSSSSSEELTLEQARADFRKKANDEENKRVNDNIRQQVKLENALREKGIVEGSKKWLEAMEKNQRALAKEKQISDLKSLAEVYAYESNLNKQLAEEKSALNKAIMNSELSSVKEKFGAYFSEVGNQLKQNTGDALKKGLNKFVNGLTDGLDTLMETYASYQARINARIQGAGKTYGSMENTLSGAIGVQPYIKNQKLVENLNTLVDSGIAYNVELRAFIQTVSENIATTFDATNGTLLRLIRLQQSDSTAARLGLEANLTRYFNGMYQNTEYLSDSFDAVAGALIEASSFKSNNEAIQFEYQVQKWLGSLYSAGLSSQTVEGLAQALGYLGSGNYSALGSSQYQSLIAMAASRAGLSYGSLLTGGLGASETNKLLESVVEYLQEISSSTSQVVKSGMAQAFGVNFSDLKAATNLTTEAINNIAKQQMNYGGAISELSYQLGQLPSRLPLATMLSNVWSNLQWGQASNIAASPTLYSIWKVTSLIQDYTGGINIPSIFAMGSGVDLNTTVENLVKLGVVGISTLGMIGDIVSGISNTANPSRMLSALGGTSLSNFQIIGGAGLQTTNPGLTTASTVYAGNASGDDMYESAKGQAKQEAQAEAEASSSGKSVNDMVDLIQQDVYTIRSILQSIQHLDGIKVYSSELPV